MTIAELLRRRRLDARLQQVAVAAQIGVSQASYSAWERAESVPKAEHISPIATFLDLTETEVLRAVFAPKEEGDRLRELEEAVADLRAEVRELLDRVGRPPKKKLRRDASR